MSKRRKLKSAPVKRRLTLREESLIENKELGLEKQQEQMDAIFSMLKQHGINSRLWLEEYLIACESNGGNTPPDFERFLPWNMSPEDRKRLSKDSFFSYGDARFVAKADGSVFHLREDGKKVKVNFGDMTGEEFDRLVGFATG